MTEVIKKVQRVINKANEEDATIIVNLKCREVLESLMNCPSKDIIIEDVDDKTTMVINSDIEYSVNLDECKVTVDQVDESDSIHIEYPGVWDMYLVLIYW